MASPATTATPSSWKRPRIAAASAGTMNSVYATGISGTIGAIRMPATAATAELIIQLTAAMRSGDSPLTYAPFSVSAAARVASPKRVKRNASASTKAMRRIVAANQSRSPGTRTSPNVYTLLGKMASTTIGVVPTRAAITCISTTITPNDATAFATDGAARSGRNTRP